MEWKVGNALSRDVERQHLNKILAEIRAAIDATSASSGTNTTTIETTTRYAVANFLLSLSGDVTGSSQVDGLNDVTINTTLADGAVGIEEAPIDNQFYWRWNAAWSAVPPALLALGEGDAGLAPIDFSHTDSSPRLLYTTNDDVLVDKIEVIVRTVFDGTAPQLAIGTALSPELLMPFSYNSLQEMYTYEVAPGTLLPSGTDIFLTLVPGAGATAGDGQIVLSFINT